MLFCFFHNGFIFVFGFHILADFHIELDLRFCSGRTDGNLVTGFGEELENV